METDTYANLLTRIQALAGVDAFTTTELTLINSFINRRAYQAYRYTDSWARFLTVLEARPGPSNVIPYDYTASDGNRLISSATRSGTTVTVTTTADIDGDFVTGQYVTIASLGYTTANPNGSYQVTVSDDDVFSYDLSPSSLTGTETYTGSGTVVPVALDEVDSFIRVSSASTGSWDYKFYVQSDGCHVVNNVDAVGFWVTYKKVWDGPYVSGDDVPREFFDFIAHASYADFLRMDRQNGKALAEEQVAMQYLMLELERPQNQANNQQISRFKTHASQQSR